MSYNDFKKTIAARQQELKNKSLPSNISPAQFKMLKHLWDAGNNFPRNWVPRSELHELINQSDYRRRLTELKDERGIDIELDKGKKRYRLKSSTLNNASPRAYLSGSRKKSLFSSENYLCQTCGIHDLNNSKRVLQADHKIPLSRGGPHIKSNWQTLCCECNVGKRRACQGCIRDCQKCVWAYPEKYSARLLLSFDHQVMEKLLALKLTDNDSIAKYIQELILSN